MGLITGLDHVNLLIDAGDDALPRARAFYQELLGLVPLERPANTDSGNPGAWYQCGVQQLHLTTEKDASVVNRNSRRHPAFRVASLAALRQRLESAGRRNSRRQPIPRPGAVLRARPMGQSPRIRRTHLTRLKKAGQRSRWNLSPLS
jgi:catechol 2,3-dioxygenase-like lactoylglutathione lyase family enzyme